jgi:hypothetical protein
MFRGSRMNAKLEYIQPMNLKIHIYNFKGSAAYWFELIMSNFTLQSGHIITKASCYDRTEFDTL